MARYINTETARIYVSDFVCEQMEKIPAADVVEVVRCGECERRSKGADLTNKVLCMWFGHSMDKTDFCSYGERKCEE